jgi:arsenate reductase
MNKTRVLFLCTGNSARSQMGEALLRKHAGDRFEVYSAGLEPKGVHPLTLRVMREMGVELDDHSSKHVREYMGKLLFGYLITVCSDAEDKCPAVFPGVGHRLHWSFEDPAAATGSDEEKLQKFRDVRDRIDQKIRSWLVEPGG